VTSSFRLANELQGHLLLSLLPIGCSFQEELLLQLIIELLDSLGRVPFSRGSNQAKGNPLEKENKLLELTHALQFQYLNKIWMIYSSFKQQIEIT